MYRTVLFDLDGTLTDPKEGITKSVAYALAYFGIDVEDTDTLTPFIGPPLVDSFMERYGFPREKALEAVEKYREYFAPTGIFENKVYMGIPEMLAKLQEKGITLALATSKPEVFAKKITAKFGLDQYLAEQCGSELNGDRIKKADVIEECLKRIGAKKEETVMIGDKSHDVLGAKAAGVASIAVRWGYALPGELEKAAPDAIAEDIAALYRMLTE
ncbi:MAG: HAD family hydrolase [Clostridiales bacterium]|nr:HAD family hydrolase [Clostridiales bacterium]